MPHLFQIGLIGSLRIVGTHGRGTTTFPSNAFYPVAFAGNLFHQAPRHGPHHVAQKSM